jgi:hypothetical protein
VAAASDIILEVLSIVAPGLVGPERDKLATTVERLINVALRSMSVNLSKSSDTSVAALVTRLFTVNTDSNGNADLTTLTTQTDRPIIISLPFLAVRNSTVPQGELYWLADPQSLSFMETDSGNYFYTVEGLLLSTKGGDDGSPLASQPLSILAPFIPSLASINETLRSYLLVEILSMMSQGGNNGDSKRSKSK